MANTVVVGRDGVLTIVPDGSADFDIATYFPNGINLRAIRFDSTVGTNVLKVREKTVSGVFLIPTMAPQGVYTEIVPRRRFPYIKAADCTLGTPSGCLITIYFD